MRSVIPLAILALATLCHGQGQIAVPIVAVEPSGAITVEADSEWQLTDVFDANGNSVPFSPDEREGMLRLSLLSWVRGPVRVRFDLIHDGGAVTTHWTSALRVTLPMAKVLSDLGSPAELSPAELRMVLCWVPPGEYPIGIPRERLQDPEVRRDYLLEEQDTRSSFETRTGTLFVDLLHGFWMAQTEVTVAQWRRFRPDDNPRTNDGESVPDDYPMAMVDFEDARAYCKWLLEELEEYGFTGFSIRLPSELEWEIAARGTGAGPLPADVEVERLLNATVRAVASNPDDRTPFGVFDMLGNLREWTATPYRADLPARLLRNLETVALQFDPSKPDERYAPVLVLPDAGTSEFLAVRGGAFRYYTRPNTFDVSWRRRGSRTRRNDMTGFRFVVVTH